MALSNSLSEHEIRAITEAADFLCDKSTKLPFAYVKHEMKAHGDNLWAIALKLSKPPTKGETDGTQT